MSRKVRVFLCDDSAVARLGIRRILSRDPEIEMVGEAADGAAAVRAVPRLRPDLVLMDVLLPGLDGLEVTRELLAVHPWRILLVTNLAGVDADLHFKALAAGALDVMAKPGAEEVGQDVLARRFCRRLKAIADVPMVSRRASFTGTAARASSPPGTAARNGRQPVARLLVGASTGGPPALLALIASLGRRPPWPILVVQHITPGFVGGLARWLAGATGWPVEVAAAGIIPGPGITYLAPDGAHLTFSPGGVLTSCPSPPRRGHRPSIDELFESVAKSGQAASSAAALLTGMGDDGARGLLALRRAGAFTLAQDAAGAVVASMPESAVALGAAQEVLALREIGPRLLQLPAG